MMPPKVLLCLALVAASLSLTSAELPTNVASDEQTAEAVVKAVIKAERKTDEVPHSIQVTKNAKEAIAVAKAATDVLESKEAVPEPIGKAAEEGAEKTFVELKDEGVSSKAAAAAAAAVEAATVHGVEKAAAATQAAAAAAAGIEKQQEKQPENTFLVPQSTGVVSGATRDGHPLRLTIVMLLFVAVFAAIGRKAYVELSPSDYMRRLRDRFEEANGSRFASMRFFRREADGTQLQCPSCDCQYSGFRDEPLPMLPLA